MTSKKKISGGFTLAELLIVIMFLVIGSAVVIPYASGISESQSQAAARIIATDLEYAHELAIASCQDVIVQFDCPNKTYSLSYQSGVVNHPITKKEYIVDMNTDHSLNEVIISTGFYGDSITFDSTGAVDDDEKITLTSGSQVYYVEIDGASGNIVVNRK